MPLPRDSPTIARVAGPDDPGNMSHLSVSGIGPAVSVLEARRDETLLKDSAAEESAAAIAARGPEESRDYVAVRYRYEKRIRLLEKRIEELKVDGCAPARRYRQVRSANPVEEAFEEVVGKVPLGRLCSQNR